VRKISDHPTKHPERNIGQEQQNQVDRDGPVAKIGKVAEQVAGAGIRRRWDRSAGVDRSISLRDDISPRIPMGFGYSANGAKSSGRRIENVIAQAYGPIYAGRPVPPSTNAGAGYLFSYFAYFGYWAIAINLILLFPDRYCALGFGRVSEIFLTPLLAALSLATLKFLEADYSTVWLSHGTA